MDIQVEGKISKAGIIIILLISIALILGGVLLHRYNAKKEKDCSYQTTAVVTDVIKGTSGGKTKYRAEYTYECNGSSYTVKSKESSSNLKLQKGDKVELYVNPSDPTIYRSDDENGERLFEILLYVAGSIGFLIMLLYIKMYNKQLNNQ